MKCLTKLGNQINANERKLITQLYNANKKDGLSELEIGNRALEAYRQTIAKELNQLKEKNGIEADTIVGLNEEAVTTIRQRYDREIAAKEQSLVPKVTRTPSEEEKSQRTEELRKEIAGIIQSTLGTDITDGGTITTVREYLYQEFAQGRLTEAQFASLYTKFMDKDPSKITEDDLAKAGFEPAPEMMLKGKKMAMIGNMFSGDRLASVYVKDGKIVITPAAAKGTRLEPVMNRMHQLEGNNPYPSPGYQLVPASSIKVGNAKSIGKLYNREGIANMQAVNSAIPFVAPREISGEQVQNPDGKGKAGIIGVQLQGLIWTGFVNNTIFAQEAFTGPAETGFDFSEMGILKIPPKGISAEEMYDNMVSVVRVMRDNKLQNYINVHGLDYSISDEWKQAAAAAGFNGDEEGFEEELARLRKSNDPEERRYANYLRYRKNDMIIRTMNKMLNEVKEQVAQKYGIDESQTIALTQVVTTELGSDVKEALKIPLTFTPGNKQYQGVFMAQIESIARAMPINGVGLIQGSAYHFGKTNVQGDTGLKGYGIRYDENGKPIGFDTAEIAIPWLFKDENGDPLPYEKYVDKNGIPIPGMIDEKLLHIISYRIPNTGLNMSGRFKIARFLDPSYKDVVLIPNILYSQTGTDLDFDKLFNYMYNYKIAENGAVQKVDHVLNIRQNDAKQILKGEEVENRAIKSILREKNPAFAQQEARAQQAYAEFQKKLKQLQTDDENDVSDVSATVEEPGTKKAIDASLQKFKNNMDALAKIRASLPDADKTIAPGEAEQDLIDEYKGVIKQYEAIQAKVDEYRKNEGFNLDEFLTDLSSQDNIYKVQTDAQLQNAYQSIYHHIMGDLQTLPQMLNPLTSKQALDSVETAEHDVDGELKSYAELKSSDVNDIGPNTEAFQINNRKLASQGKDMVGILASVSKSVILLHKTNASLGFRTLNEESKSTILPILFTNDDGTFPTDFGTFVRERENHRKQGIYFNNKMVLRLPGQDDIDIPYRLDRLTDVTGKHDVKAFLQSLLQGYLDMQKNPNVAYTNINPATANAASAMTMLGYVDQVSPFMKQEVLIRYSSFISNNSKTNMFGSVDMEGFISDELENVGLDPSVFAAKLKAIKKTTGKLDYAEALGYTIHEANIGDKQRGERYFSTKQLKRMVDQELGLIPKDYQYDMNQLHVLNMFLRLNKVGGQILHLNMATNLESKGIAEKSVLGAKAQDDIYNALTYNEYENIENLIGAERIGVNNRSRNPAAVNTIQGTSMIYLKKMLKIFEGNNNIFSDLSPAFTVMRDTVARLTNQKSLASMERFNVNIVQFILADPALYSKFTEGIFPDDVRNDFDKIRKRTYTDTFEMQGEQEKVIERSLARLMEVAREQTDETGKSYGTKYSILNHFRTWVKKDDNTPSWVYNNNTNAFKERIGQALPQDVYLMMNDKNDNIRRIAKMMFLYHYTGGGITTPLSFGHLLDQGQLFSEGGFADNLANALSHLNRIMASFDKEVRSYRNDEYSKPWWFRKFDPTVAKHSVEARETLRNFYVQFLQNNPGNAQGKFYQKKRDYVEIDGETVELSKDDNGEDRMIIPSFTDIDYNVYVINPDGRTYTRYGRAGTNNFAEYNRKEPASKTIITKNNIRFDKQAIIDNPPVTEDTVDTETELPSEPVPGFVPTPLPFKKDEQAKAFAILDHYFTQQNGDISEVAADALEMTQLNMLGSHLAGLIPKSVSFVGYSIDGANKAHGMGDGTIRYNDTAAFGMFTPNSTERGGQIEIAYDFIKNSNDPLLFRKTLLHESAHAGTVNMMSLLQQMQDKKLTQAQVMSLLDMDTENSEGVSRVKTMNRAYKAKEQLDKMFGFLKGNAKLEAEFIKQNGGKGNEQNSREELATMMENVEEMVAYMFHDKRFRDALKNIKYGVDEKVSFFDKIVEALRSMLGLEPGTAAYHAFDSVFAIMEPLRTANVEASDLFNQQKSKPLVVKDGAADIMEANNLRDLYRGVSNLDVDEVSDEDIRIYDQLVKEGKIIC